MCVLTAKLNDVKWKILAPIGQEIGRANATMETLPKEPKKKVFLWYEFFKRELILSNIKNITALYDDHCQHGFPLTIWLLNMPDFFCILSYFLQNVIKKWTPVHLSAMPEALLFGEIGHTLCHRCWWWPRKPSNLPSPLPYALHMQQFMPAEWQKLLCLFTLECGSFPGT